MAIMKRVAGKITKLFKKDGQPAQVVQHAQVDKKDGEKCKDGKCKKKEEDKSKEEKDTSDAE